MSSSRVFKADASFTPTPIVRRALDPEEALLPEPARAETSPAAAPAPPAAAEPTEVVDLEALRVEAYNQGRADFAAQWETEFQQAMAAFADACQKIDRQRRALVEHSRGDIINLIISLTRTIVGEELATPRNVIAATVQRALEQAIDSEEYYVTLHPDDLALAEARAPELVAAVRGLERLVFKTDPSLTRGGCLLESALCSVDATVETQLDSLREFLGEQPGLLPDPDQGADQA
jgi:flagellar assembly protein FliH